MSRDEATILVIREWLAKAENDLTAAAHVLKLGSKTPTDTVCFHAQQCVEKYLKSLLVFKAIPFPKTHDLQKVMGLIPPALRPDLEEKVQKQLTEYAAELRYPKFGKDIPLAEARKAVAIARRIRREVRRLLPGASLRRSKK